ncbi:MAG TPA: alpha/beta hydrolase-fold protein [Allosphingosinicella sp.]|jgi:hypothetical protein
MVRTSFRVVAAAAFFVNLPPAHSAPAPPRAASVPIEIGRSHKLRSTPLGEERTINVVLPASYGKEKGRRYPVLYLIDGGIGQDLLHVAGVVQLGALWGRSAEAIVVGIETRDRRRELVGLTRDPELLKRYPTVGASAKFRDFIRTEVKPLVERSYRTSGREAVLGESLAGLFVTETYLVEPSLFDAYAAVDPSLWWDKEALSLTAASRLGLPQQDRPLFLAFAKEQSEEPAAARRLLSALRQKALTVCAAARPDLTHATIYQQVMPQAVQYLLPPPEAPPPAYGFNLDCAGKL